MAVAHGRRRSEPVQNDLSRSRLRAQNGPRRNMAVPFDQRRDWTAAGNHYLVKLPNRVRDWFVMAVDQERLLFVIALLGMAGEMNLGDSLEREIGQIIER